MVDLVGRGDVQRCVRSVIVVPAEEEIEFSYRGIALKRNQNEPSALNLHGLDESLQDCDASMFAYGSETLRDSPRQAPVVHLSAEELSFLIRDEVLRFRSNQENDAIEQGDDSLRIRSSVKHRKSLYATREVIENNSNPPAKRPTREHGEWVPGGPETAEIGTAVKSICQT